MEMVVFIEAQVTDIILTYYIINSFHVVGSSLEVAIVGKLRSSSIHLEESSATTVCDISTLPSLNLPFYITASVASQPGKRPNRRVWWCSRSIRRCCASILKSHQLLSFGRHPIARMRTCGGWFEVGICEFSFLKQNQEFKRGGFG